MLDGAARLKDLFAECQRQNMPAVAMTDHGNMHGAYEFYHKALASDIKPILGVEAYVAPESRFHTKPVAWGQPSQRADDVSGGGAFTHMTIWARTAEGLRNLFRLNSWASIEGYFYKPRMDRELISRYGRGLMATTGCPSGEVQTRLRLGQWEQALEAAAFYRDVFGPENYFVEIMDHGIEIERRVRDGLIELARKLNLRFVVTNDSHYTSESEADAHAALLCVQTGKTLDDPNRFKFDGTGYFVKSPEQMRAIDSSEVWQDGCRNTLLIAEMVEADAYAQVFAPRNLMPDFPVPEGETVDSWLRKEVFRGLERRFPNGIPETHRKQAEYELDVIIKMGYPGYFLVVADLIRYAKENGIRTGPGRGSAAGALISYALGITELDPLAHGLVFERFLNPDRVSMPDIDMDFDDRRRGDMIRYATERYGKEHVAQIVTYGTIKAKAAIKDATRVLGYPYALGDRITKAMPPAVMGKDIPLAGIFDPEHKRYAEAAEVRALYEAEPEVRRVIDTARGLEGLVRQVGVHAAGVILSKEPLIDVLPVWRRPQDGAIITQWDMGACESIGLLKMDFLGLRNLTVLDDCLVNIKANKGFDLKLEELPLDDRKTYELLARGDTLGVFQLDGGPMRALLRSMAPDNFEDISAVGALYRPGPMGANAHNEYADRKNGRKPVVPIHPELAEPLADILGDTYGLIVYQEQVMAIAQKVAGYTLGKADLLRRAMGKKKKEILDKEFEPFAAGMRANGYSEDAIKTLWDILVPFSDYAFNKAHSAAYGLVSYWTAYLKANYPAEYMAALLTSVGDDKDKMAVYLAECRRMGIKVLPPDVNESAARFTPVSDSIRFGLAAIRNVGVNVVTAIEETRKTKGVFTDFEDFLRKVPSAVCNRKVIESLIKAGAFDSLGHPRRGLLSVLDQALEAVIDEKRQAESGQESLFAGFDTLTTGPALAVVPPIPDLEWEKRDLLAFEREMLGLYVSDHPLAGLEQALAAASDRSIIALSDDTVTDGAMVTVAGILTGVQRRVTKQGRAWASATLEDLDGSVEVLFFPNTYELVGQYIAEDAIVKIKARVDRRDEVPRLMAMEVEGLDLSVDPDNKPVVLQLPVEKGKDQQLVGQLKEVFDNHPGQTEVHLRLINGRRTTVLNLKRVRVESTPALMADIKALLGPSAIAG